MRLNDAAGGHIRENAYKYDKLLSRELVRIQRVKDLQWKAVTLSGSAVVAAMVGTANVLGQQYSRLLDSGNFDLAVTIPIGVLLALMLCCCCCFGYHNRQQLMNWVTSTFGRGRRGYRRVAGSAMVAPSKK